MRAISVPSSTTPTLIIAGGNRDFLHFYNNSSGTIYLGYDGTTVGASGTTTALTIANGFPLVPGGVLLLDNSGPKNIHIKDVYAVQTSGNALELRVQGV